MCSAEFLNENDCFHHMVHLLVREVKQHAMYVGPVNL